MLSKILIFFYFCLFFCVTIQAQIDSTKIKKTIDSLSADIQKNIDTLGIKSPNKAIKYSLIPGGGQFYNAQYLKIPVFTGGVAALAYFTVNFKQQNKYYQQKYEQLKTKNASQVINYWQAIEQTVQKKESSQRNYRLSLAGTFLLYGFNLLDAYSSAVILNTSKINHSPIKAAYYSAILPGAGQAYNKKLWKIPIVYGALGTGGFFIYQNAHQYSRYRNEYLARTKIGYGNIDTELSPYSNDNLLKIKNYYRKNMELAIIISSLLYVLNVVDATVDAHLYDFDISDDLSWHLQPNFNYFNANFTANNTFTSGVKLTLNW